MIEIVNKFLLAENRFMHEIILRPHGFTNSACEPFTKNEERIPKFRKTGDSRYVYQSKIDKACF